MASATVLSPSTSQHFNFSSDPFTLESTTSPYTSQSRHASITPQYVFSSPPGADSPTKPKQSLHGKLHRKSTSKVIRGEQDQQAGHPSLTRTRTPPSPPVASGYSVIYSQPQKSPSKQAKELIKQNLRKLSHAPDTSPDRGGIDLSLSAEENAKKTGIDLAPSRGIMKHSRSADMLFNMSGGAPRGHTRSYSHQAQPTTISTPFTPTAPFVLQPINTSPDNVKPLTNYSAFDSGFDSNYTSPTTYDIPEEDRAPLPDVLPTRTRGTTVNSTASSEAQGRPSIRVHSRSSNRFTSSSTTNLPLSRPRRSSTINTSKGPTSLDKTRASFDRTFTFHSQKDESISRDIDPIARAQTIQAKRLEFEEKQRLKERKYEEKEAKAARKASKAEEKQQRRKSKSIDVSAAKRRGSSVTAAKTQTVVQVEDGGFSAFPTLPEATVSRTNFATSGDYADIRPSTSHSSTVPPPLMDGIETRRARWQRMHGVTGGYGADWADGSGLAGHELEEGYSGGTMAGGYGSEGERVPPVSRKRAVKGGVARFSSWFKTRMLNLGRD